MVHLTRGITGVGNQFTRPFVPNAVSSTMFLEENPTDRLSIGLALMKGNLVIAAFTLETEDAATIQGRFIAHMSDETRDRITTNCGTLPILEEEDDLI